MTPDHSNGRTQLVSGIVEELPLPGECRLEAVQHPVESNGQLGNVVVDGPLSLDVALYKEVAEHKKVKGSSVAGDPDCLLFPNLESANVFFKSVTHLCGGELAAMVMGTKVPCVLTSRGDTSKTKLFSIALACLAVKK